MLIVLIGYMGSGKSVIGKMVASKNGLSYLDLDTYIEEKEHLTVSEIFKTKGEIYFRKKEREYLKELLDTKSNLVLALGGGTPCFGDNMDLVLEATPNVFYLKATVQTLLDRLVSEKTQRPLIKDIADADLPEFIQKHLFERNFYYLRAPKIVKVDQVSVLDISEEISKALV